VVAAPIVGRFIDVALAAALSSDVAAAEALDAAALAWLLAVAALAAAPDISEIVAPTFKAPVVPSKASVALSTGSGRVATTVDDVLGYFKALVTASSRSCDNPTALSIEFLTNLEGNFVPTGKDVVCVFV